ncbi:foldase protein PrsA [Acetitomaculum ruminis DSM 5522]|uniref:Foldase protein PrsA n=1 Tax=Acetitomaculum ruminis DSM 5522 TaxID=1120918 RepID=A0A1I0X0Q0_9FIRM|nr:hypothetical protein [Acetitomaculum ruminis]SFA93926.1 foldase protein PrsA [Acetitomaculum ruminis DSM 5522]
MYNLKRKFCLIMIMAIMSMTIFTGCSNINPNDTVATLDKKNIRMGVASFMAKYQQASYDQYKQWFGEDMWSKDISGNGSTLTETVKENVLEELEEFYLLDAHKADYNIEDITGDELKSIEKAAEKFIKANTDKAIKQMGTSKEDVVEYLRLYTIKNKMHAAIIADVDTNVSDEEAAQKTVSYVKIETTTTDDDGNQKDLSADEIKALKDKANSILNEAKNGGDLEELIKEDGYSVDTHSYDVNPAKEDSKEGDEEDSEESSTDDTMKPVEEAANALTKEGSYADLVTSDDAIYIVRLDSLFDKEATNDKKEEIVSKRQDDKYQEVLDGWKKDAKWEVNNSVWDKLNFDTPFSITTDETAK